jgi:hypothetical protein
MCSYEFFKVESCAGCAMQFHEFHVLWVIYLSRLLCWPRWRTVTKNIIGQMVVDAVSEINVALALKTSECSELWRMLAQSLVQMDDIFAANENIFSACHKMHWNVDLVKPRKVIGRCRGLVHS